MSSGHYARGKLLHKALGQFFSLIVTSEACNLFRDGTEGAGQDFPRLIDERNPRPCIHFAVT